MVAHACVGAPQSDKGDVFLLSLGTIVFWGLTEVRQAALAAIRCVVSSLLFFLSYHRFLLPPLIVFFPPAPFL